jgi:hypothetical protein
MSSPSYLDRILNDGTNVESWLLDRVPVCGASDAARFHKPESVESYVDAKLREFRGNSFTAAGHNWEDDLCRFAGVEPSKLLIHAPGQLQHAATPDGLEVTPSGIVLAEAKIKHNRVVEKPTAAEMRQMAWQQYCVGPEVVRTEFVWGELLPSGELRERGPQVIPFTPNQFEDILGGLLLIAVPFIALLNERLAFEKAVMQ